MFLIGDSSSYLEQEQKHIFSEEKCYCIKNVNDNIATTCKRQPEFNGILYISTLLYQFNTGVWGSVGNSAFRLCVVADKQEPSGRETQN